jgi:LAO/AO transport system kinase
MELADLVVVNKADGDLAAAAGRSAADHRNAVHLLRPRWRSWTPEVLTVSSVEGTGIAEVWSTLEAFRDAVADSGELEANRAHQAVSWFWSEVRAGLVDRLRSDPATAAELHELEADVAAGRLAPVAAARRLLTR